MGFIISSVGGTVTTLSPYQPTILYNSGVRESYAEGGLAATVKMRVPWLNHYGLVPILIGAWTGTPPSSYTYTGPFAYPYGGANKLFCTSISSIEPFGKPILDPVAGYPWLTRAYADITAEFSRPPWQPAASGGYFSIDFAPSGEFLTVPNSSCIYSPSGVTVPNAQVGIVLPHAEITVTRYRLPFLPDQIMMGLEGQVNNAPFTIGWNTYDTETLLFMSGKNTTSSDILGNLSYTMEYKFMFKPPYGWNFWINQDGVSGWTRVTDRNGNNLYTLGNFETLP